MDHSEAVRLNAAEKYLLGELSAELRDQYEDHYFGCMECAQDVRAGAAFIDNARDVWKDGTATTAAQPALRPVRERGSSWWAPLLRPAFAVPALALLLLVAAYQNAVTIPQLKSALSRSEAPQTLPSFSLIAENSRSAASRLTIAVPADKPFSIFVDIPPQMQFSSFVSEFQSESGTPEFSFEVSAEEAKHTVQLLIPPGRLAPGMHVLVVRGLGSPDESHVDKIAFVRYPFTLENTK
jgi:hypothetical protein